jgi:hypothetical protein
LVFGLDLSGATLPMFFWRNFYGVVAGVQKVNEQPVEFGGLLQHGKVVAGFEGNVVAIVSRSL